MYSTEFRFTQDGVPVVPIAIATSASAVSVSAAGRFVILPEGDGGPVIEADGVWSVNAAHTRPATLRYWTTVWRGEAERGREASEVVKQWQGRRLEVKRFEQGTLFAVAGEVLDRRQIVVAVAPQKSRAAAERRTAKLRRQFGLERASIFAEMAERPSGRLVARGQKAGVTVTNEGVLWFAGRAGAPLTVEWTSDGQSRRGTYHGQVYVTVARDGALAVVNAVPANQMLAGLVPAEIFPSAPAAALQAQAVAARGELLAKIGTRHHGEPFRLCSQVHCQVYAGASRETPQTTAAVEATRGEVLFVEGKDGTHDLVDAVYSANCGGHTEHNENAWLTMAPHAPLRGHRDYGTREDDPFADGVTEALVDRYLTVPPPSYCGLARNQGGRDRFRWVVTRSRAEMDGFLAPFKLGSVVGIDVLRRGVSGRAMSIRVRGSRGQETIDGELTIRRAFGGLRSSLFVVTVEDGAATFRGGGFGHGVGMCQTGAVGMGEAKHTHRQILRHYYRGSVIRKLW